MNYLPSFSKKDDDSTLVLCMFALAGAMVGVEAQVLNGLGGKDCRAHLFSCVLCDSPVSVVCSQAYMT